MKRVNIFVAFCMGIVAGFAIGEHVTFDRTLSPHRALHYAKRTLQKYGPIQRSWIYIQKEKLAKNGINYDVYRGGISRNNDDEQQLFTFFVDVKTGTILEIDPPLPKEPPL